jgi:signal transduction histidine kinase
MLPYYLILFKWVAAKRLKKKDLDARIIHAHIITVITTGALMWSYTIVASLTIDHPLPTIVGIVASLIHLLSPQLFRLSSSGMLVCSVTLGAGMAHQLTFAWFSGGFNSPLLIWLGILPMLAGIIVGRWGVALWSSLTISVALIFLYLELSNYAFPQLISTVGLLISQALLVFGWIFLSTVIIVCHLLLQKQREQKLTDSKQFINDLLQILTHDLNTPISVIAMVLPALQKQKIKAHQQAINIIEQAHRSMVDITEDVRRLYTLEHDGYKTQCQPYSLNQSVSEVSALLQTKMTQKRINLRYDFEANESLILWVDPSIFNHQVMTNILSNAIKFSFYNSDLNISAIKRDNSVRICIQDYGIGMSKENVDQLYNTESKVSRPGTQGEKGSGYGMLIMKRALDGLQGKITIQSKERRVDSDTGGTLFIIDISATK